VNTKNLSDRSAAICQVPATPCRAVRAGDHVKVNCRLKKSFLLSGSTKIFGISPIGLGGDVAGTGLPEQRDGLVVEGFDA
jgi:hypothetical protein